MAEPTELPGHDGLADRSNWVRLQTLVLLRWLAIAGQLTAIVVADAYFGIRLALAPCLIAIGFSVLVNLLSSSFYPRNRRLSELEALVLLAFDSCQLASLLYLTGGLNNPFALLILAPATIAATALAGRATATIGTLTVVLVSLLAFRYVPLRLIDGTEVGVPPLFGFGFWLAIVIGVVFLALYARRVSSELYAMSDALLATQMALAREQKLTDLSGVVAAAAHELGTPLATIKLTSTELADELRDHPALRADAELIRDQTDRCRDILRSMGRAGNDDLHMRAAPFSLVVQEAAEPHRNRHATVNFTAQEEQPSRQPLLYRRPEIIYGLRNLVQNAVDFSTTNVWIDLSWSKDEITMQIVDDGPGFPASVLGRIGDPYMRQRPQRAEPAGVRGHYEGMGLGLFIAKTLLERTGAKLKFENAIKPYVAKDGKAHAGGALVKVSWPRGVIEAAAEDTRGTNAALPI